MTVELNVVFAISLLFLTASGLAIIFGLMGVLNLAHGDFIMLGAFVAVWTHRLPFVLSVVLAAVVVAVYSLPIERLVIRRIYERPAETILATFGIGIVTRQAVTLIAGGDYRSVADPLGTSLVLSGQPYPAYRIVLIGVAIALFAVLLAVLKGTSMGAVIRGVIENPRTAAGQGINVGRTYLGSFALGAALAGMAGALISPLVTISPDMGFGYVVNGFLAVLAGGAGSIGGLAGASGLLGASDSLVSRYVDPVLASMVVLVLAVVAMQLRANGFRRGR